jgi:ABC-type antimicrobial peptide transport system permease subunit
VFGDLNSVQWILHLGLGGTLDVTDGQGKARKLVIAGLLSSSIFQSQLVMSEANFLELFPDQGGYNLFLIEAESAQAGTLLEERFADRGFDATRSADRLASYLVVENTYLSTFLALGGLGLLLGTLGLAVVMVRNVIERRAELALLQAVGFNRSSISWLVLAENVFVLVFGILVGTVTALLAVSPHLLSRLAEPPWGSLSLTLLAILFTGLLAGVLAVKLSLRGPLTPALRRE